MEAEILKVLRSAKEDFVSGEELGRRLGVSRSALWKSVQGLRKKGYEITGKRSSGYRLVSSPDILTAAEISGALKTGFIGRPVVIMERTSSTNTSAMEMGVEGATEGTAVVAETQDLGRGRMGRRWISPRGINLYTSILLRPDMTPAESLKITLAAAVAAARTVERASGLTPEIKWPNDILLGGRKVAGILTEMTSELDALYFVVVGIGINVNMEEDEIPVEIRRTATSLAIETGRKYRRALFAADLFAELERVYLHLNGGRWGEVLDEWRAYAEPMTGRDVRIRCREETIGGIISGVDDDGALILRDDRGNPKRILAGDVLTA
ncbi:biotin--[acetyl-CoA-carboxylase] ligase [Thermodesulfobacteriota bacterium]